MEAAERAGREVARHLQAAPEYVRCRRLVVYAELPDELPLTCVVATAGAMGKRLLWPRWMPDGRIVFARAERIEDLSPGRYGVREPPVDAPVETLGPDVLVLAPGVAFDESGGRLGRGGGAWDRALANDRRAVVFGVGYEFQVLESIPCEEHDRRMDGLLTEVRIRRFGQP